MPGARTAALRLEAERAGGVARRAEQRLRGREAEERATHVQSGEQARDGRGARVEVGRHCHRDAALSQQLDGRLVRLAQKVEGAGEQHGNRAIRGERGDVALVAVLEMRAGEGTETRRERRAAERRELLRMRVQAEAECMRVLCDAAQVLEVEGDVLDEDVGERRELLRRDGRQHALDDVVQVVGAARRRRHGVRAEEGRHDRDGHARLQRAHGAQHLDLRAQVQPVAALDLDAGDTLTHERRDARQRLLDELLFRRCAHGVHRRADAPARAADLLVGRAAELAHVLVHAVARVERVRMAIDEAGQHAAAARVDALACGAVRAEIDDAAVAHREAAFGGGREIARHGIDARVLDDEVVHAFSKARDGGASVRRSQPAADATRARVNSRGGAVRSSTQSAASAPIAGPSLKPCPEPPPASHAFAAWGWRSRM
jgi:hypothetical protein